MRSVRSHVSVDRCKQVRVRRESSRSLCVFCRSPHKTNSPLQPIALDPEALCHVCVKHIAATYTNSKRGACLQMKLDPRSSEDPTRQGQLQPKSTVG